MHTFIDILQEFMGMFVDDGEAYVSILPRDEGEEGDFRQVALVSAPVGDHSL